MTSDFSLTTNLFLTQENSNILGNFKLSLAFVRSTLEALILEQNLILTPTEIDQLKFFHPKRQLTFMLGRKAYSLLISSFFEKRETYQIHYGVFGNPFIKHPDVDLSLSHTANCSVASLFPRELFVGVDIEQINEEHQEILYGQITEIERFCLSFGDLKSYTPLQGSVALWTMKESMSKAVKCGLSIPYFLLETEKITEQGTYLHCTFKHFPQFQCLTWISNSFAFSVTFPKNLKSNHDEFSQITDFLLKADGAKSEMSTNFFREKARD